MGFIITFYPEDRIKLTNYLGPIRTHLVYVLEEYVKNFQLLINILHISTSTTFIRA
jgi:hypothetical protein